MSTAASQHFTVPQLVRLTAVPAWAVRRAVDALDPAVPRVGLYRLIPADRLDEVLAALRRFGYMPPEAAAAPADHQEIDHAG